MRPGLLTAPKVASCGGFACPITDLNDLIRGEITLQPDRPDLFSSVPASRSTRW